ncbi:MAG: ABC transporter substrate-binding protein [Eubacteriaceae bacterium]|nr:ABC transporter substrate-binding protein [Eubacteriaceae bacterium]
MPKLRRLASVVLAGLMLASALAGCVGGGGGGGGGDDAKTLKIGLDSDILKLDPAYAYDFTTNPVINQISQGLMYFDQNTQLAPLLAKSWRVEEDGLAYIYDIRDDATFSDGTPMEMEDVVYSLNRHFDDSVGSLLAGQLENVESITQSGDWELTVKLKSADSTFINTLAGTVGHVVKKEYCEAQGDSFGSINGGLIGTGPYKYVLGSWVTGTGLKLERNENYWNEDDIGYYDILEFKVIAEETTRVAAIQNGDVDILTLPPPALLDTLYGDAKITVLDQPSYGLVYMAFNYAKKPFDDPRIHKAVAHGINFVEIHQTLVKRAGQIGTAIPGSEAMFPVEADRWQNYRHNTIPVYEYNPEKAAAFLAEAGYADGLEVSLMTNEDGMRNAICLAIQEQLGEIGINVTINKVSGDEHTSYQFGEILEDGLRGYDILMAGWSADYPDIGNIIEPLLKSGQTANAAVYSNPEIDALIVAQFAATDPIERNDLLFELMDIVTEELPYLVALHPIKTYALSNKVTGLDAKANWVANVHFQDARPAE